MMNEEREDRWVAALCHASAGILLFGVIAPLIVWITQKDRSKLLRFQTLQALAYQSLGTLAYILLNVSMFIIAFGMMGFMFLSIPLFGTQSGTTEDVGGAGGFFLAVFIIVFVILMIIQFLMIFAGPLYILLGLWAGLRVLKGKDFRYPILGKMIADRLDEPAVASPT